MEIFFNLGSAGNTENPSLVVLHSKGYELKIENVADNFCHYFASRDGRRFVGQSATEVLGLVALWEFFGDDWRKKAQALPDMYDSITIDTVPDDEPLSDTDPSENNK